MKPVGVGVRVFVVRIVCPQVILHWPDTTLDRLHIQQTINSTSIIEGPAYIQGDNQSVFANTTVPDSTLKKKSQFIAYHFVREGTARDEWRTANVNTHDNEADLLTKALPFGAKRVGFV